MNAQQPANGDLAHPSELLRLTARLSPGEDGEHFTFCRICEAFCGMRAEVKEGRIVALGPDRNNPHSQGHVCVKGTRFADIVNDKDRVLHPLRRDPASGSFEPVSWDSALDDIADRTAEILRRDGPIALANYIGNPAAFGMGATLAIRPFFRSLGVTKMFAAATQDATARMVASQIVYGSVLRLPIPDLTRCDFLIAIGANMLVSHGSLLTAPRIREDLDAIAKRGRVLVIDPRRTETATRYDHLFVRPDTDAWLLAAMLNVLFDLELADAALLDERTSGWRKLQSSVSWVTPELAERYTGIVASTIVELTKEFAATERAAIYGRTGTCRGNHSTLVNVMIDALNIAAGKFAVAGGWVFGDAAIDMAAVRPGGFSIQQTRFGPSSNVGGNYSFSLLSEEILVPGEGQVKALFVTAGNIVVSSPGSIRTTQALQALDLFVALDLYVNETNKHADYVLPVATFLERDDVPLFGFPHMVRPFAQYTAAVVEPLGEARIEDDIFNDLAKRLHDRLRVEPRNSGYLRDTAFHCDAIGTVGGLLQQSNFAASKVPGGLDELRLAPHGIHLADTLECSNSWSKVLHPDGRIGLWHPLLEGEFERLAGTPPLEDGELRLFSQRTLQSINSWMHNLDRLVRSQTPTLLINPSDAGDRGIADGTDVEVCTAIGSMIVPARVTDEVVRGSVCYPHGWGHAGGWRRANATLGQNVNVLSDPSAGEALSASALFDGIRVSVTAVD
jgi:anaerobic selenocysteine-containing dehydrogenase